MTTWKLPGYTIQELLGTGGDGDVWRARITATGEAVAVKRIRLAGADRVRAARAEAAMLATLDHPNLLRLHELVVTPEAIVLVVDLAAGGCLASLVAARGRLTPGEVISVLSPIAGALAHVHAAGVVHGDVTPGNVLLTDVGLPLLADLGVARIVGDSGTVRTTPAFAEPSVACGHLPAPAGDVFMLGGVALHALTGTVLWPGDTPEQMLAAASAGDLDAIADRLAQAAVPAGAAAVVCRALNGDPRQRGTAAEFALDLRCAGRPVAVELAAGRPREQPVPRSEEPAGEFGDPAGQPYAGEPSGGLLGGPARGGRHAARPIIAPKPPRSRRPLAGLGRRREARSVSPPPAAGRPAFTRPGPMPVGGDALPLTYGARPRPLAARPMQRRRQRRWMMRSGLAFSVLAVLAAGGWLLRPVVVATTARAPARATGSASVAASAVVVVPQRSAAVGLPKPSPPATSAVVVRTSPEAASARSLAATARAALTGLDAIRAHAFAARSPGLLAQVYGAAALREQDAALLRRIVPPGCRLVGVHTTFGQVTAVRTSAGLDVTTVARMTPSTLACGTVTKGTAPGDGPVSLHIALHSAGAGYRIVSQSRL